MYVKAKSEGRPMPDSTPHKRTTAPTPEEVLLVKESWAKVVPNAGQAAALFYGRLFELDPSLRLLFTGDMREQGAKLTKMLDVAVDSLDRIDTIVSALEDLGRQHVGYGVENHHYDTVGAALLWSLGQGLGDDFTDDVKGAWATVYGILANTMKEAAATVAQTTAYEQERRKTPPRGPESLSATKWSQYQNATGYHRPIDG